MTPFFIVTVVKTSNLTSYIQLSPLTLQTFVLQLVESQMTTNMSAQGILMDGFPRDMNQVYDFENKVQ
jgi:adenylate kinase family enzyme